MHREFEGNIVNADKKHKYNEIKTRDKWENTVEVNEKNSRERK